MAGNIYKGRTKRAPLTAKRCAIPPIGCGLRQAVKHFERRAQSKDGYRNQCKRCMNRRGKAASTRASRLRRYGITPEQYNLLMVKQGGCCAICHGVNHDAKRLSVDHEHRTKKVRGLLCDDCNRGIGLFDDDAERLKAAIKYLRENQ